MAASGLAGSRPASPLSGVARYRVPGETADDTVHLIEHLDMLTLLQGRWGPAHIDRCILVARRTDRFDQRQLPP